MGVATYADVIMNALICFKRSAQLCFTLVKVTIFRSATFIYIMAIVILYPSDTVWFRHIVVLPMACSN